jgi:ribonuclease HI
VPRAELHAAVHFLRHTAIDEGVKVDMHIDNAYVVDALHSFVSGWRPTAQTTNGDLWADLLDDSRGTAYLTSGKVQVFKIKAHLSLPEALARGYSKLAWQANRVADELAEQGARRSAHSAGDQQLVAQLDRAAGQVVRRLQAVARFVLENRRPFEKVVRAPQKPLRRRLADAGEASGHELKFSAGVRCTKCRQHSRMKPALTGWATVQCPGPGARHGHAVQCIRGLTFCTTCGHWASLSGASSRGMHRKCTGQATKRGSELLTRLASQPPKLPDLHGRKTWPDGTPADSSAALAAAGCKRRATGVPSTVPSRQESSGHQVNSFVNLRLKAVYDRVRARSKGKQP